MVDNDGSRYSNIVTLSQSGNENVILYPNPAKDHINITVANTGNIRIYDASGRLVKTQTLQSGANNIDVSALNAGTYYAEVSGKKVKFLKE